MSGPGIIGNIPIPNNLMTVGGLILPSPKFISSGITTTATASSPQTLYTCPNGRKALWRSTTLVNPSGNAGTIASLVQVNISGSAFILSGTQSVTTNNFGFYPRAIVLTAGQQAQITSASHNGGIVFFDIIEFDASAQIRSVLVSTFVAGFNTIYTVPAGLSAIFVDPLTGLMNGAGVGNGYPSITLSGSDTGTFPTNLVQDTQWSNNYLSYVNQSGGTRTFWLNLVPNGQSAGTGNQISPNQTTTILTNLNSVMQANMTLGSGDAVTINVDANTVGQFAWVNVIEI